jgi:antitoxin VapB
VTLNIKDPGTDRLVRELADATGESITTAVRVAVRERLDRVRGAAPRELRSARIGEIAARSAARPRIDTRSDEEILGYDARGLPT